MIASVAGAIDGGALTKRRPFRATNWRMAAIGVKKSTLAVYR